jgi:hypothetical protein
MDKFLDIYELPKLNQENINNLKRPIMSNGIIAVADGFQQRKSMTR